MLATVCNKVPQRAFCAHAHLRLGCTYTKMPFKQDVYASNYRFQNTNLKSSFVPDDSSTPLPILEKMRQKLYSKLTRLKIKIKLQYMFNSNLSK
jgi:hypothetical protein